MTFPSVGTVCVLVVLAATPSRAQTTPGPHEDHRQGIVARGDHVMGFDHAKTTHHFRLYRDGGAIEVAANDPTDTASFDEIRAHLRHIAGLFAEGNFDAPMLIHDRVPPGVPTLKRKRRFVRYAFERTPAGARVRIRTSDPKAVAAVHEFLRFQISDHQTHDCGAVERETSAPAQR